MASKSTSSSKKKSKPISFDEDAAESSPPVTPLRGKRPALSSSPPREEHPSDSPGSLHDFIVDDDVEELSGGEESAHGGDSSDVVIVESTPVKAKAKAKSKSAPAPAKGKASTASRSTARAKVTPAKPKPKKTVKSAEFIESESDDADLLDGTILQPGDSPYPEKARSLVNSKKRNAPVTPPIGTRRTATLAPALQSAVEIVPSSSRVLQASPTKKAKLDSNRESAISKPPSAVSGKAKGAKSVTFPSISTSKKNLLSTVGFDTFFSSSDPEDSGPVVGDKGDIDSVDDAPVNTDEAEDDGLPTGFWVSIPCPSVCEVTVPELKDPFMEKFGLYEDMPNLCQATFDTAGPNRYDGKQRGRFVFGNWRKLVDAKFKLMPAVEAISFVQDDVFVNLSRISPSLLAGRPIGGQQARYELVVQSEGKWKTALCLSLLQLKESFISTPLNTGFSYYCIKGVFHTLEWERFVAVLGMVSGHSYLYGQVWNSVLTLQTRSKQNGSYQRTGKAVSDVPDSFYNTYESPRKPPVQAKKRSLASSTGFINSLPYDERIPVYDGRKLDGDDFTWTAGLLDNIASKLPIYTGAEIPIDSMVYAGYVTQLYCTNTSQEEQEWKVNIFIRFVIILAIPKRVIPTR